MYNKHYENQGYAYPCDKVDRVVTVRLFEEEIAILKKLYPGKTISYAIRSLIHKCNTSSLG